MESGFLRYNKVYIESVFFFLYKINEQFVMLQASKQLFTMIKLMINISLVKIKYIDPHQYNKKSVILRLAKHRL